VGTNNSTDGGMSHMIEGTIPGIFTFIHKLSRAGNNKFNFNS